MFIKWFSLIFEYFFNPIIYTKLFLKTYFIKPSLTFRLNLLNDLSHFKYRIVYSPSAELATAGPISLKELLEYL